MYVFFRRIQVFMFDFFKVSVPVETSEANGSFADDSGHGSMLSVNTSQEGCDGDVSSFLEDTLGDEILSQIPVRVYLSQNI